MNGEWRAPRGFLVPVIGVLCVLLVGGLFADGAAQPKSVTPAKPEGEMRPVPVVGAPGRRCGSRASELLDPGVVLVALAEERNQRASVNDDASHRAWPSSAS